MYVAACCTIISNDRVKKKIERCMTGCHKRDSKMPGVMIGHAVDIQNASRLVQGDFVADFVSKDRTILE